MKPRRAKIEPKPKPKLTKPTKPKAAPQPRGPFQAIPDREPLPGVEPISILDLPNRPGIRCRFPVVGGYCGADCGEHTYCQEHRAIAYIPALPKPRPPRGAYFGTTRL